MIQGDAKPIEPEKEASVNEVTEDSLRIGLNVEQ